MYVELPELCLTHEHLLQSEAAPWPLQPCGVAKQGAQDRSSYLKVGLDSRLLETPETSS